MRYVKQQITEFLTTNAAYNYAEWVPTTTYTFESGVPTAASIARKGLFNYRSLVSSNLDFDPDEYLDTKWVKWAIANPQAMLDMRSLSKTVLDSGDLTVTFALTTETDSIVVGNYEARNIKVEILDELDVVLWTYESESSVNNGVVDWWTYLYATYGYEVDRALLVDIPMNLGTKARVTFLGEVGERTACGYLIAGQAIDMGETLYGVKFGFNSFAVKEFDAFGSLTIVKRNVQDLVDFETSIPTNELMSLKRKLKEIYNDVVVFVLDPTEGSKFENMITLGIVENADVLVSTPVLSSMTWSILEVI